MPRWFMSHAHETDLTPGLSVGQLRKDTQSYAPRFQVRAASCWQTWLNEVLESRIPGARGFSQGKRW
jgi:GMP synthase (glutamine-hydrolysing)